MAIHGLLILHAFWIASRHAKLAVAMTDAHLFSASLTSQAAFRKSMGVMA